MQAIRNAARVLVLDGDDLAATRLGLNAARREIEARMAVEETDEGDRYVALKVIGKLLTMFEA